MLYWAKTVFTHSAITPPIWMKSGTVWAKCSPPRLLQMQLLSSSLLLLLLLLKMLWSDWCSHEHLKTLYTVYCCQIFAGCCYWRDDDVAVGDNDGMLLSVDCGAGEGVCGSGTTSCGVRGVHWGTVPVPGSQHAAGREPGLSLTSYPNHSPSPRVATCSWKRTRSQSNFLP